MQSGKCSQQFAKWTPQVQKFQCRQHKHIHEVLCLLIENVNVTNFMQHNKTQKYQNWLLSDVFFQPLNAPKFVLGQDSTWTPLGKLMMLHRRLLGWGGSSSYTLPSTPLVSPSGHLSPRFLGPFKQNSWLCLSPNDLVSHAIYEKDE